MKKHIIAALAVLMLGTAAMAQPAAARWCWTDGHHWMCRAGAGPSASWQERYPERKWYPF